MSVDRNKLTVHIVIGMIAGVIVGGMLNWIGDDGWVSTVFTNGIFHVVGRVFLRLLQVLVVPLVFVSLVCGTAALDDVRKVGRVGLKTVSLYLFTTAIAVTLALAAATLVQPGQGFNRPSEVTFSVMPAPPLTETLINLFPSNPVQAMAEGKMLQIIIFAVLVGLAIVLVGQPGKRVLALFADVNDVVMRLVTIVMKVAPFGVFALLARTFAQEGFSAIAPLAKYFFLVFVMLIIHGTITYSSVLVVLARLNPIQFFRNARAVFAFAFSTASSNATLPVTLETMEKRMGVHNSVASFTIPLGATINMDGTAIMQGVATVFIAGAYGIDLSLTDLGMVIVAATLASIGTAGVPGVGLIMLGMVLKQVGLPEAGIGLIVGVDRLLDMTRTMVNVTGDMIVTCVVARSEKQLDQEVFDAANVAVSD